EFFLGAVVSPVADPAQPQIAKMEKKIEAGARFFQTQAVYDLKAFENFMKSVSRFHIPVMGGIVLLKSAGMAKFMNEKVAGVSVPERYIKMMASARKEERVKVSISIAAELIKGMKDLCQGIHIMPLGWEKYVPEVLTAAGF
ncbi:MAG TPA: methylenetetrahydrofolate reductase, partial [bacterium]|nr:methylenetetrahydrofolate reductase [bacterium]